MKFSNLLSPESSLIPFSPFILSDEEIVRYYPDINPAEIEKLKCDLLVIAEVFYRYAISRPEKPDTESDTV